MSEENLESTNIHLEWLKNIYQEIRTIQDFERMAREGCRDMMEYLQIPMEHRAVAIPDSQYKNIRFLAMELDILIGNLSPVLKDKDENGNVTDKDKTEIYRNKLKPILKCIDNRNLFLKDKVVNNQLQRIDVLPFLYTTIRYLISIKSDIIKDIGHILYLPEETKKSW